MLMMNPRSSPATPVRVRSPDSITITQSPGSSVVSAISISPTPGNTRRGGGAGSRLMRRTSLPRWRSAYAIASCDPIASPSGRTWEVSTNRRRFRISSTARARPSTWLGAGPPTSLAVVIVGVAIVRASGFLFMKVAEDLFDAVLVLDGLVEPELDFGNPAQADARADLAAEERRRPLERLLRLDPLFRIAERRVEDLGDLEVGRDLHARERDEADARVVDVAPGQHLAQLLADLIPDAIRSISLRHKNVRTVRTVRTVRIVRSFEPFERPNDPNDPNDLCRGRLPHHREDFDDVAHLDVVVPLEADTALEPGLHLGHVVLEAAQRS